MSQRLGSKKKTGIYDYDYQLQHTFVLIKKELSENNLKLIEKYDLAMVNDSLSKATRHKNLKMILSLSRLLNKDWNDTAKIEKTESKNPHNMANTLHKVSNVH